ncbi:MAG: VWA domain-containing protein [Saprospiraceae bacterium]
MEERLTKWRMILGKQSDPQQTVPITGEMKGMDETLDALYDSERQAGLGSSSPNVNRWLGDIRKYFPSSVVQVMQKDALERLNLQQMLFEPEMLETIEPDVALVGTLISLKSVIPQKTKETARRVVRKVVEDLEKKLRNPMREAVTGALSRSVRNRRPKLAEINWHATIKANLKHYQHDYKSIIPHQLIGYGRKGQALKKVILLVDQSGSMASSVVYASVFGAVMASLKALKTNMVVFDTAVVDLTKNLEDPVDLLFGAQLGGGTDINKALGYVENLIQSPSDTILVLISDLYEGGNKSDMLKKAMRIKTSGVQFITLLALSNEGAPMYDKNVASSFASMGIPAFACTPDKFPALMAAAINKEDITKWNKR